MKKYFFILLAAASFTACNQSTTGAAKPNDSANATETKKPKINLVPEDTLYGKAFNYDEAQDVNTLLAAPEKLDTTKNYVVSGTITQVCQSKGCWFRLDDGKGGSTFIKLVGEGEDDEEPTIPKDSKGKSVLFYGMPSLDEVSVKAQKHFLEDAGASKAEIDAVKAPKKEWRFYSTSVVVRH